MSDRKRLIFPISASPLSGICQHAQILILKILNVFLRLKFSPSLTLKKLSHFQTDKLRFFVILVTHFYTSIEHEREILIRTVVR